MRQCEAWVPIGPSGLQVVKFCLCWPIGSWVFQLICYWSKSVLRNLNWSCLDSMSLNWFSQLQELFFQNRECIENFSWQFFCLRVEKRKNRKLKKNWECIEKKNHPKCSFKSWKVNFFFSKSRVKLEILNLTMAHGMGHLFFLLTVFTHLALLLLSAYAK